MRVARPVTLTAQQQQQLQAAADGRRVSVRLAERARIVLLAAQGLQDKQISAQMGIDRITAAHWRNRYLEQGYDGLLKDAPRSGRPRTVTALKVQQIIERTTQTKPANATQWSTRSMAAAEGVSEKTVRRIWNRHGLKPHLLRGFKLSNDKQFAAKLEDVVALYLNPPEHALVLSCDEKSQIQALDRTQPLLPMAENLPETRTHDYVRNGTTTLFAALNTLDGKVIHSCMPRHRHQEWIKFLKLIDEQTPPMKQLHLIVDNYATHKHPKVKAWLRRHPRFHMHFTPTSSSWLNMVERFFRDLTVNRIRRGTFGSVQELIQAIEQYLAANNQDPKPFIWTAKARDILAKVSRARRKLDKLASE
jgi:transposase